MGVSICLERQQFYLIGVEFIFIPIAVALFFETQHLVLR
jgi:hypothetical protein